MSEFVADDAVLAPTNTWLGFEPVRVRPDSRPLLFVVIDTDEEFDWNAPLSRSSTSVKAICHIDRLQTLLSGFEVKPTYVVDFPIVSQPGGCDVLKDLVDGDAARIGAHLHPWVNPPFVEEISARNSYGFRLGSELETEKIRILQAQIADRFGELPRVYKAGRYGFGLSTVAALETLNFTIDVSVNPRMDFSSDGGPSFEAFDSAPFWFGRTRRLLELPCSTDYTGIAGSHAPWVHHMVSHPRLDKMHLAGVLARLGIVNRVHLSPELSTLREMVVLTNELFQRGLRTFSLTLHSPSVMPGCTPYVRTAGELRDFLGRIAAYCDFFLGDLGGLPSTPEDFRDTIDASVRPGADVPHSATIGACR